MDVDQKYDQSDVLDDKGEIPFAFGEFDNIECSINQDKHQLDKSHNDHASGELIIFYHFVEGEFVLDGHPIIEAEYVHQYHQLHTHHNSRVIVP